MTYLFFFLLVIIAVPGLGKELDKRDRHRCSSQGDYPSVCPKGNILWDCETFFGELKNFAATYKRRPIEHNSHGVGVNHAFSLWFVLKKLAPKHVIENGVYKGQGTWIIRDAVGASAKIYCIDPRDPKKTLVFKDENSNTQYFMGDAFKDFSQISWSSVIPDENDRANALVVLDDHMSSIKRVQQMISFGFTNLWYDDNWKYGKVDVYSFNTICSPTAPSQQEVLYMDNFGTTKIYISLEEHRRNVEYLRGVLDIYFEFPALYNICDNIRSTDASTFKNRSCLSTQSVDHFWYTELESKSPYIGIDFMTYFPPYAKLRSDALKVSTNGTTPFRLKDQSTTTAGADTNTGAFKISLSG